MLHNDSLPIKWICHCCLVRIRMLRRSSVHLIHVSLKGSGIFGFNCWPSSHMIGLSKKSFVMCLVEAWRRMRWAEMSWHWAVGAKGGRGGAQLGGLTPTTTRGHLGGRVTVIADCILKDWTKNGCFARTYYPRVYLHLDWNWQKFIKEIQISNN